MPEYELILMMLMFFFSFLNFGNIQLIKSQAFYLTKNFAITQNHAWINFPSITVSTVHSSKLSAVVRCILHTDLPNEWEIKPSLMGQLSPLLKLAQSNELLLSVLYYEGEQIIFHGYLVKSRVLMLTGGSNDMLSNHLILNGPLTC